MAAVLIIIVLIAIGIGYTTWLRNGVKPRVLETSLPIEEVRSLFADKVARTGWTIVDDGNPMVAQSPLITGVRQQIGLRTLGVGDRTKVEVRPMRLQVKVFTRVPTKGHTLRIRMNSFVAAVRTADPSTALLAAR